MNTLRLQNPSRRDFLIGCAVLATSTGIVRSGDDLVKSTIDVTDDWFFEDGSGQGGISISLHPPGGGHFRGEAEVVLIDAIGKETTLVREKGHEVYVTYLPPGRYGVCVKAKGFRDSCYNVETRDSGILMLPIYLGEKDWPVIRLGGLSVPFEPIFDEFAIALNRPLWRDLSAKGYRDLVELLGRGLLDVEGPKAGGSPVGAKGSVLYFKGNGGEPIFNKIASDTNPTKLARTLMATLRTTFPKDKFGEIRVGVRIKNRKALARILDNRFLIRFASGVTDTKIKELQDTYNFQLQKTPCLKNVWEIKFNDEFNYLRNLNKIDILLDIGIFTSAEPDLVFELKQHSPIPTDPWYSCQKYIQTQKIDSAWGLLGPGKLGNPNVAVTMIDSGVNRLPAGHPDLRPSEITCVDLVQNSTPQLLNCEAVPSDAHGMGIFGVIGAEHNDFGVSGIAPNAAQVAVRMCDTTCHQCYATMLLWAGGLTPDPVDFNGDVIPLVPAVKPASVINCSHGIEDLPLPSEIRNAIRDLAIQGREGLGTVLVYSTGENDGANPLYGTDVQGVQAAASSSHTLIVANTALISCGCSREVHDPASNFGRRVDLCAFGGLDDTTSYAGVSFSSQGPSLLHDSSIDTNLPQCSNLPTITNGITRFGRSSAAAAMVSGVATLMLSARSLTLPQVRTFLRTTADKIDSSCPTAKFCSGSCCEYSACENTVGQWKKSAPIWGKFWVPISVPNGLPKGLGTRSNWYGYGRLDAYSALLLTLSESV